MLLDKTLACHWTRLVHVTGQDSCMLLDKSSAASVAPVVALRLVRGAHGTLGELRGGQGTLGELATLYWAMALEPKLTKN